MSNALAFVEQTAISAQSDAERLGGEITELCGYLYAAEARLLTLIREFDEKCYWETLGLCSCAHWLNLKCGIGMNAAREKVRVAHALAQLPKISTGFSRGELSYSKVRAMTRIANTDNEDYLLSIARHGTAHHVEKLVAKFRTASRLQDTKLADDQYCNREVTHYYDHDGCLVIKARLPAEQGALIVKALEMAIDAEASQGDGADEATSNDLEPIGPRRADALAQIAETYMNNSEASGSTADRYQVVVHVNAGNSDIEDGPHVTAETSRRISCDSTVVAIREDDNGEPLSIGRRSRAIPPPMRRALRIRDGGCRFPGCTHTRFVDGHHIKHWADGGETRLSNLILLCRHHHHLVHEGGYDCCKSVKGEVYFSNPTKQRLHYQSGLSTVASDKDLDDWFDRAFFGMHIDTETCVSKWNAGEKIDWQMAVSALF